MKVRLHAVAVTILGSICVLAAEGRAQSCSQQSFAVAPRELSGARINSLTIATRAPDSWVARAPIIGRLHARTHANRIASELLFAAGDTVDTLRVAESMRRLRSIGLFEKTELVANRCVGSPGVDLTIATRDAWTLSPVIKARGGSADIGLSDRNAFGTGTSARVVLQSDGRNLGLGFSARVVNRPLRGYAANFGNVRFANGQSWHATIGNRNISAADKSTLYLRALFSEREPITEPGNNFQRSGVSVLFGHRISGGLDQTASYFLYGAETEHADLHPLISSETRGSRAVRRSYAGVNAGFGRVAAHYDTLSWMLPSKGRTRTGIRRSPRTCFAEGQQDG